MTVPGTSNGNYLGGLNGGYWQAVAQAQGYSAQAANLSHMGALSTLAQQAAAASRPSIEDAGIRAGEITAFRAWVWKDGLLHSMAAQFVWIPGAIVEGDPSSGLGVHAFKTLGDAVGQYGFYGDTRLPVVFGTVSLWGDVIEHEKGYRAEFAAIESLVMAVPGPVGHPRWKFWKKPRNALAEARRAYGLGEAA
jgi:hypothetical protein